MRVPRLTPHPPLYPLVQGRAVHLWRRALPMGGRRFPHALEALWHLWGSPLPRQYREGTATKPRWTVPVLAGTPPHPVKLSLLRLRGTRCTVGAPEDKLGTHGYSHATARVLPCTAAAALPRAARAALSCAGAYVSGAASSNECPAGSLRIEAEAACRTAAAAAGKTPGSTFGGSWRQYPRGCYFTSTNVAYFNTHAVGAGDPSVQLLCAVATTGAPISLH
jgi:hypothetical protein